MPMDPPCQCPPPRLERRNMAPLATPSRRKEHPPPRDFFTKLHTNCPFLPSFLIVQWHVMGTILGVMQGGGENAIRIFSHFPHFFSHFLGRSLSVMFKRIHSSGIV